MTTDRIFERYRNHDLIVALRDGVWRGRVAKNKKTLADVTGDACESVFQAVKEIVDKKIEEIIGKRGDASPSTQEYIEAFKSIMGDIHDGQFAMLKAHYLAPDRAITATQLAEAANYAGYESANLHYGKLGQMLCDELNLRPKVATHAIATDKENGTERGEWLWMMRPEVAEAVEFLGLDD